MVLVLLLVLMNRDMGPTLGPNAADVEADAADLADTLTVTHDAVRMIDVFANNRN